MIIMIIMIRISLIYYSIIINYVKTENRTLYLLLLHMILLCNLTVTISNNRIVIVIWNWNCI